MKLEWLQKNDSRDLSSNRLLLRSCVSLLFFCSFFLLTGLSAEARTGATPWTNEPSFQNLVYASSTTNDVIRTMGAPPDDIVRATQMFPVIENYYYYGEEKTGAATVFVFEHGLLVGLQLKTPGDQYVDMTYVLTNNGDRALSNPIYGGYLPYFPYLPLTTW